MTIAPISVGDVESISKINQAIDKANLVDSKAAQVALQAETDARNVAIAAVPLPMPVHTRPGESNLYYTTSLAGGDPATLPNYPSSGLSFGDAGLVIRVVGDGLVASRSLYPLEPGKKYLVEYAVQRRVNSPDPDNDAIRCALAWYDQARGATTQTVVQNLLGVTSGSGRLTVAAVVSRSSASGVNVVSPDGARYCRPYVQTFGTLVQSDVEVIRWTDITNASAFSPDLTALTGQVTALESVDAGSRLTALEGQVTTPNSLRLATRSDLVAATVPASVKQVEVLGEAAAGDGGFATYERVASGTGEFQSADGADWRIVAEQARSYPTIDGMSSVNVPSGIDTIRVDAKTDLGDGQGGAFKRVSAEPSQFRKFQSAGGAWWEFSPNLIYPGTRNNLGDVIKKARAGETISIAMYGDSITYGQDLVSAGLLPPENGATQTRSPNPIPETLSNALFFSNISANVINRGFPGDNTIVGTTRWASASATDVAFIMYGHNDANNYGGEGLVPVDQYRLNLGFMIERELAKGAAVIILGPPPVLDRDQDKVLRSYVSAARRVAAQYGVPFVDLAEQLSGIYDPEINSTGLVWTDGVHLAPAGYVECGAHLAALFTHGEEIRRAVPGAEYFVEDRLIDEWESTFRQNPDPASGWTHFLVALPTDTNFSIACRVDDDCVPVITLVNAGTDPRAIKFTYAQGWFSQVLIAENDGSFLRTRMKGPKLHRGIRLMHIRNESAETAFIESIRFERVDGIATTRGVYRKSSLSGVCAPSVHWSLTDWWAARDTEQKIPSGGFIESRVLLPSDRVSGISLMGDLGAQSDFLSDNQIMAVRSTTSLLVHKIVAGVVTTTTIASVFTSGVDFEGSLSMTVSSAGGILVYKDGLMVATVASPNITEGYAGLVSQGLSRMRCDAMMIFQP
jgi:lysophospholipase L1-like esterase